MLLQFIVAMVTYAMNERMARRIDYLLEGVRVLREVYTETTGRRPVPFTDAQRQRLAVKGKALTAADEREECCQIVRPAQSWPGSASLPPPSTTAPRNARSQVDLANPTQSVSSSSG